MNNLQINDLQLLFNEFRGPSLFFSVEKFKTNWSVHWTALVLMFYPLHSNHLSMPCVLYAGIDKCTFLTMYEFNHRIAMHCQSKPIRRSCYLLSVGNVSLKVQSVTRLWPFVLAYGMRKLVKFMNQFLYKFQVKLGLHGLS